MTPKRPIRAFSALRKTLRPSRLLARRSAVLTLLAVGAVVVATATASGSTPPTGGTIYYGAEQEPPCLLGGWVQNAYIARQILDSLVSEEPGGKIVPWLATSWKVSSDQLTWTFKIKPNIHFTDGTPLNAAALVSNFQYWLNPTAPGNSDVAGYLLPVYGSSTAVNNLTFQVTLTKPYPALLSVLAQGYAGIQSPTSLTRPAAQICDDPIGSGPFIVQQWNQGQDIVFVRNPNYDSAPANALHQGPAYVDKLVWSFLADPTERYGSLTTGESDVIYDVPTVDWATAQKKYNVQQYITPGRPDVFSLNTYSGPFSDVLVRQAFAYAINRKGAVESAFHGKIPYNGNGALSQSTPDYDAALANTYPYDPAKARTLLNEAGWTGSDSAGFRTKSGTELDVNIAYLSGMVVTEEGVTMLQDIQQEAKAVGFNVNLVPVTQSQFFAGSDRTPSQYDALFGLYFASPTPSVLNIIWQPWTAAKPNPYNSSFFANSQLASIITEADTATSPSQQKSLWYKAQQIIVNQAAAIGVYTQTTSLASTKKLHGVWIEASQGEPVFSDAYFAK